MTSAASSPECEGAPFPRIGGDLLVEFGQPVVEAHRDLPAQTGQQVFAPLVEVDDVRGQSVGVQADAHDVDRRFQQVRCDEPGQEQHPLVHLDHVPAPVDEQRGRGLVGLQDPAGRFAHRFEFDVLQGRLAVDGGVPGGQQQPVAFP